MQQVQGEDEGTGAAEGTDGESSWRPSDRSQRRLCHLFEAVVHVAHVLLGLGLRGVAGWVSPTLFRTKLSLPGCSTQISIPHVTDMRHGGGHRDLRQSKGESVRDVGGGREFIRGAVDLR